MVSVFNHINDEAKKIFSLIQEKGPLTKGDLLNILNMKLTTLNRFMSPLEAEGLIVQSGISQSTGGRKPVLYDVNPEKYYAIGIDISRTYTQIVITNMKISILFKREFSMDESCSPGKTVSLISQIVNDGLEEMGISRQNILGAGLGTVGPLNREEGVMINPVNFSAYNWNNVFIKNLLEEELKLPVIIDNGANTAVLAESLFGEGRNFNNVAYLNCGIGIRTGVISSGNIVRSINDWEDVFGHMVIDVDGEKCSCGNFGCIECYSSIPAVTSRYGSELKKGHDTTISKPLEDITYLDICQAGDKGDELAVFVLKGAATILGVGLANYINLLSPELVILSGPLMRHSQVFYEVCREVALKKCYLKGDNGVVFSRCGFFSKNAIAAGAASMLVRNCLK